MREFGIQGIRRYEMWLNSNINYIYINMYIYIHYICFYLSANAGLWCRATGMTKQSHPSQWDQIMMDTVYLVGGFNHSEKSWSSSLGMIIPNTLHIYIICGKIIQMFQSTNQWVSFPGKLDIPKTSPVSLDSAASHGRTLSTRSPRLEPVAPQL
jgi:hypothetical protein